MVEEHLQEGKEIEKSGFARGNRLQSRGKRGIQRCVELCLDLKLRSIKLGRGGEGGIFLQTNVSPGKKIEFQDVARGENLEGKK